MKEYELTYRPPSDVQGVFYIAGKVQLNNAKKESKPQFNVGFPLSKFSEKVPNPNYHLGTPPKYYSNLFINQDFSTKNLIFIQEKSKGIVI